MPVELIEHRGIRIGDEYRLHSSSAFSGDTVRVTHTTQVRIEEDVAKRARVAAERRSGALSVEAVTAAIQASELDFESEPNHGAAQRAAIYALGTGGNLTVLTGAPPARASLRS